MAVAWTGHEEVRARTEAFPSLRRGGRCALGRTGVVERIRYAIARHHMPSHASAGYVTAPSRMEWSVSAVLIIRDGYATRIIKGFRFRHPTDRDELRQRLRYEPLEAGFRCASNP